MKNRLLTAAIALPILIAAVILPVFFPSAEWAKYPFLLIAALALGAGMFEFFTLTKSLSLKADAGIGYLGAGAFFLAFFFDAPSADPNFLLIIAAAFLIILLISQMFRFQEHFDKMLTGAGVTLLGVLYVAFLGGYIVAVRTGFQNPAFPHLSTKLLVFFLLVLMLGDSFALFTGKYLGKNKLAPKISPGKTWEGCAGGLVFSLIGAAIACVTFFPELKLSAALPLAAAMNVLGVLGDLAESAIKRGSGAKDAANILPGHGGLLDRLDSLLFNAPLLYYFAKYYFGV